MIVKSKKQFECVIEGIIIYKILISLFKKERKQDSNLISDNKHCQTAVSSWCFLFDVMGLFYLTEISCRAVFFMLHEVFEFVTFALFRLWHDLMRS